VLYKKYLIGTSATNTQTLTAWSYSNWNVVSAQPNTSGVKSYPNSGLSNLNMTISGINSLTSPFNITVPSSGNWEVAFDLWIPTEVMVWMYVSGNVGPIAEGWDSNGNPIPSATNVTVGGYTWNVYHGGKCGAIQFGFEISGTGGVPETFTCNNFSMSAQ
jgi:hypothetical protein